MVPIKSLKSLNNDSEIKKAVDQSKDTFWSTFKNNGFVLNTDEKISKIVIEFQRGFQPKAIKYFDQEIKLVKNQGIFVIEDSSILDFYKAEILFLESYDPYGRIFVYEISLE